jgi:ribonucleoside-diphosphate reductase alpha chain
MGPDQPLDTRIARPGWESRYRAGTAETSVQATWRRVGHAVAEAEPTDRLEWGRRLLDILRDFQFLPGGRIHAGAGTGRDVTLFNCFVMGTIEDSIPASSVRWKMAR